MSSERDGRDGNVVTWVVSRRVLMGTAATLSAVSLLPLSATLVAAPGDELELLADWSIDDMWGVYPRYAEPIAFGRPISDSDVVVASIDAQFLT